MSKIYLTSKEQCENLVSKRVSLMYKNNDLKTGKVEEFYIENRKPWFVIRVDDFPVKGRTGLCDIPSRLLVEML